MKIMSDILIEETRQTAETKAKQIPDPCGYRLLCMVPMIEETYSSGLIKAEQTMNVEQQTTLVLFVAKLGPQAYKDATRFPDGPWCKKGDFVIVRAYTGTRVLIHGTEWRIINDDTVEAVVEDPRGIKRAGGNV
jgi:co-chaperonin GroES (HSP10)